MFERPALDRDDADPRVERQLAEVAARFINLPREEADDAMADAHGKIGQALGLDRVTMWRLDQRGDLVCAREWTREGVPPSALRLSAQDHLQWTLGRMRAGELVAFATLGELPDVVDRATHARLGTRSGVTVPLAVWGRLEGAMAFETVRAERRWTPEEIGRFRLAGTVFANVLARRRTDEALWKALVETEGLRDQLRAENVSLRREVRSVTGTEYLVGQSGAVRQLVEQLDQVAATGATVLLTGERGTGKELLASYIHASSPRRDRGMVRVNCAAVPAASIEVELFGREKGPHTDALSRQPGRFELAHDSTIFLDEIGDLPADVQVRLLRVLEDKSIERLGSPQRVQVDVRVIAATHRNLERLVAAGAFREDLYHRLSVFPIRVPPLRERVEDIPVLVWRFVDEFSTSFGKPIESIAGDNMEALKRYPWPGNIRELRNVVERAMIGASGRRLVVTLPPAWEAPMQRSARLVDVERQHIASVLELTRWRIRGEHGAAVRLGMKPTTLETRMAKLGLVRPHVTQ